MIKIPRKEKILSVVIIALLSTSIGFTVIYSIYDYSYYKSFSKFETNLATRGFLFFNTQPNVTFYNPSQVFENLTIFNIFGPPSLIFHIYFAGQIVIIDINGNVIFRDFGVGFRQNVRVLNRTTLLIEQLGSIYEYNTLQGIIWKYGLVSGQGFTGNVPHHDMLQLPNGNILTIIFDKRRVNGTFYEGIKLIEINKITNEVVWNWSVWDHYDLSFNCSECIELKGFLGGYDWVHANALAYNSSEDTILLNMRNFDQIIKINHSYDISTDDLDSIIWRLGGKNSDFTGNGVNFSHTHGCEIINGSSNQIILFDNGLHRDWGLEDFSRVLIIEINETDWTSKIVWNYNETPPFYSEIWSYAEQLPNGNILITDGENRRVIEVNYTTQEIVWKMQLPKGFGIYRAYRLQQPFDVGKLKKKGPLTLLTAQNYTSFYSADFYIFYLVIYSIGITIVVIKNIEIHKKFK